MLVASCGGKTEERSGLDRSRDLSTMSLEERAYLCDWAASMTGGYGAKIGCRGGGGDGGIGDALDQKGCLWFWANGSKLRRPCTMTVAQLEDCLNEYNDAPVCERRFYNVPACAPLGDGCP